MTRRPLPNPAASSDHSLDDDFDDFLSDKLADPAFAAAFEDAAQRARLVADLVACRKSQRLYQKDVAHHMGVGQSVVSEFETAANTDAHLSTLQRYARAIGARLGIKIEMPADQTWAAHVDRRYALRVPPRVQPAAVVKKPDSAWLNDWAHEAMGSDRSLEALAP